MPRPLQVATRLAYALAVAMEALHEVKGAAFVTLERVVSAEHGPTRWRELVAAIDEPHRAAIANVRTSDWYPEEAHAAVLRAAHEVIAGGDIVKFEALVESGTTLGIKTFARAMLAMTSPAFVVRRCPTLWSVIRRGPAVLEIEQPEDGTRSLLHYSRFPYFDQPLYQHYFRALLGAVVRPTLRRAPTVRITGRTRDTLDVEILHG